jgi:exosortase B
MSSVLDARSGDHPAGDRSWMAWWPIGAGLLALYIPTYIDLSRGIWTKDEYLHGPIVLAVTVWIIWQLRAELQNPALRPHPVAGWPTLVLGLLLYVLGRSQDILIFEIGSQIVVLAAIFLLLGGWPLLRRFWFPLFFAHFMIPIPGFIVDALTAPLKHHVSVLAEQILYWVGYPIARTGVVLSIGPYQLLVADACSGLHSLISMSAMGLLYIYLSGHTNRMRVALLVACLLPIAFAANVVRVMVLVVVTYHFGDEAGQGFIHGFSGVFLFVVGLMLLFGIDALLGRSRFLTR